MTYTSGMRILLLALLAASSGCVIAVDGDGNPHEEPPPPPPANTAVVVVEPASEDFMLKYRKRVPEVYEGIKKAAGRLNIKLTDAHTPGDDNWRIKGYHASGGFDLEITMNRHDHKTRTTVTIRSTGRANQFQCREWTRRVHAEIGKQIGEDGFN